MIGFILKIVAFLVIGVLTYNFFFGDEQEKTQSSKVFGQMKDVAVSVGDLAKSEKSKFDAGKYDTALDKLGAAYQAARAGAQNLDAGLVKRIGELEKRKANLKEELESIEQADRDAKQPSHTGESSQAKAASAEQQQQRKAALQSDIDRLLQDSETLLKKAK